MSLPYHLSRKCPVKIVPDLVPGIREESEETRGYGNKQLFCPRHRAFAFSLLPQALSMSKTINQINFSQVSARTFALILLPYLASPGQRPKTGILAGEGMHHRIFFFF